MGVLEGLFTAVVVGGFFFWVIARVKKKSFLEFYNDIMDTILGRDEYGDVSGITSKLKNPLSKLSVRDVTVRKPRINSRPKWGG